MKKKHVKNLILVFILVFSTFGMINLSFAAAIISSRTYTIDADFDEGVLVGLEHDTVIDQLQLSKEHVTLPFIWVPNTGQGTVSKINTETGDELGRYWVMPDPDHEHWIGKSSSPSRTTVDLQGNCWVGNRQAGTVVKIGLFEAGIWHDRNGDGVCQTSQDENNDGNITGDELLPWGEDECVLFEVNLYVGNKGTYVPGAGPGIYDIEPWRTSPRGLAIDADNNLWAGTCPGTYDNIYNYPSTYHHIDGETGAIMEEVVMKDHAAYGAVIDPNGILWSSMRPTGTPEHPFLVRFDPETLLQERIYLQNRWTYGLGLDYLGNLFVSGWNLRNLHRVNINRFPGDLFPQSSLGEWTKGGPYNARGVACTADNDVWVASTSGNRVYRYDNNGNLKTSIVVGNGPTGVAVDAAGKVWVCNVGDEFIKRIDPNLGDDNFGSVDLEKRIIGSGGHYGYSDMTGIIARTITTRIGTWTVTFDSDESDTPWGTVSWNGEELNSITVKVRSSNDESTWSAWETAKTGEWLSSTPNGRYLEIETTLQIVDGEVSPILYDLTVNIGYLDATIDFDPNTLNSKSKGKWVTIYTELPEGYDVNDIVIESIMLGGVIPAEPKPTDIGDYDSDGIPDLMVKFDRSAVIDLLPVGDMIYIMICGTLGDGTLFKGTDVIRVI